MKNNKGKLTIKCEYQVEFNLSYAQTNIEIHMTFEKSGGWKYTL